MKMTPFEELQKEMKRKTKIGMAELSIRREGNKWYVTLMVNYILVLGHLDKSLENGIKEAIRKLKELK